MSAWRCAWHLDWLFTCLPVSACLTGLRARPSFAAVYLPGHPSILPRQRGARVPLPVSPIQVPPSGVIPDPLLPHGANKPPAEIQDVILQEDFQLFLFFFFSESTFSFFSAPVSFARYLFWTVCPSSLSVTEGGWRRMALLHNVFLCNVWGDGGKRGERRIKRVLFFVLEEKNIYIYMNALSQQQIKTESLSRGDFQLLAFAHKPMRRSGPAPRHSQKCRNLNRISGR